MFKNLMETMGAISGKNRAVPNNQASEIEKVIGVAFMLAYYFASKFISKFSGVEMTLTLSIVAVIVVFAAHQLDKKLPFQNKHFWKMITILLMAPVFLLAGV